MNNTAAAGVWLLRKLGILAAAETATGAEAASEVAASEAGEARKLAAAVGGGVKWLAVKAGQFVVALAQWAAYEAASAAAWAAYYAKMAVSAAVGGAKWLAATVAQYTAAAAAAVVEAGITAAAWIAANLAMILATGGIILAIGALILIGYELIQHWQDVKRIAGEVWDWIQNAVTTASNAIGNAVSVGMNWVTGLFSGLPGRLLGALGDLGSMFWNVGMDILKGIWAGIQAGWNWLTSSVSNLAGSLYNAAKSALGIGSPSKVFADEIGAWIAPGIAQGIDSTAHQAVTAAQRLAAQVTAAASGTATTNLGVSGGALGTPNLTVPTSGTGGQVINLQLTVQGSVWTTQDLARELQTELLKYGIRNPSSGINYAFS